MIRSIVEWTTPEFLCACIAMLLIVARRVAQFALGQMNLRHVKAHADKVPEAFRDIVDDSTYSKSVAYTLAKGRLSQVEQSIDAILLLIVLVCGVLPWWFDVFQDSLGSSAWAMSGFLFSVGVVLAIVSLPMEWFEQFRLEQKFGFNTTTPKTWWMDRVKGFLLALILGYPLLVLILKFVEWTGDWWWLWAWGALMVFQLVMLVLAPVVIMPLFNKFTPLPEGELRERLLKLADRTDFRARSIQVMDGSKRSRHSNAFFTGFGRFRKIVIFDTLIEQLGDAELEAVLAHEIGHYKKKHIVKLLVWSALSSVAGFYAVSVLARQDWFYRAFGFEPGNIAPALLLFALLAGAVTFWLSPLMHWMSRRFEYEADAFAAAIVGEARSLVGALRKLSEKNLSNLTPHPVYSAFYYSHPTLVERERALVGSSKGQVEAG